MKIITFVHFNVFSLFLTQKYPDIKIDSWIVDLKKGVDQYLPADDVTIKAQDFLVHYDDKRVLFLECPSEEHAAQLHANTLLNSSFDIIVHMGVSRVLHSPLYKSWLRQLSDKVIHVYLDETKSNVTLNAPIMHSF